MNKKSRPRKLFPANTTQQCPGCHTNQQGE